MGSRDFIAGPNFSGRSRAVHARAHQFGTPVYFLGPYAEAALSGLSSTIADEIELYRAKGRTGDRPRFGSIPTDPRRKPQTLSGGEQVLLALHCFSLSAYKALAIDTALEQLDASNRSKALTYLNDGAAFDVVLTDNRARPPGWTCSDLSPADIGFACNWDELRSRIRPRGAPVIAVEQLSFGYRPGHDVFGNAAVTFEPGQAHRLFGPNGAGKTTLLKLLIGALVPRTAHITLDGAAYEPWRSGNRALALATQNPDQQWCGATLREDLARRRSALARRGDAAALADDRVTGLARYLGVASLDQHLYELPLAARKRISWLWPFAGAHPWIMLDEPTIGQDNDTCRELARTLAALCGAGYGVVFVTHDDAFASAVPHRALRVANRQIS
jgi:energy-coupling factor transporter ATP-binding protein EcfA2